MTGEQHDGGYHRFAIITADHPAKPLEGTVVAIGHSHCISIDDSLLSDLVKQAHERFDIESYSTELRLGTFYFDASSESAVGVAWDDTPMVYEHGDFDEPVETLPDNLSPVNVEPD